MRGMRQLINQRELRDSQTANNSLLGVNSKLISTIIRILSRDIRKRQESILLKSKQRRMDLLRYKTKLLRSKL
jgi:hypothetical protein